jgi:4-hydroxy-tetrahydrodipicolinate synthase
MERERLARRRDLLKGFAAGALLMAAPTQVLAAGARPFRGIFPIGSTPVDPANRIDYEGLANQVAFLRKTRVPGIAWPQLASGWSVLTPAERFRGAEALVSAAKGGSTAVIIGVQSQALPDAVKYAEHAAKIGADGVICIPPPGVEDPEALLSFYQQVGRATSLPFFVQAIGSMSVDLIVKMAETIPTLKYIKDEAGEPVRDGPELIRRTGGKLTVFSGRGAGTLISELERGFQGSCPYVSLADGYQGAFDAWQAGDHQRAFQIFAAMQAANTMLDQSSPSIFIARNIFRPGTTLRTIPPEHPRPPRYVPAQTPDEVRRVLDTYLRPYLRA